MHKGFLDISTELSTENTVQKGKLSAFHRQNSGILGG